MSVITALLILLGTVGALLLFCRVSVHYKTKRQDDAFDERQKLYQEKAQAKKSKDNVRLGELKDEIKAVETKRKLARENGLKIPVVYNTGSYETPETVELLLFRLPLFTVRFYKKKIWILVGVMLA